MEKIVSLSQKVIRGGAWVFTLNFVTRGLGFIRTVILARLLLPSDFGLVGIALIATSALLTFSGTGFATALIQKKSGISDYLNTAWCVEAIRGIILAFILFLLAPPIATFFNNPEAKPVIQVMAIAMALGGFTNVGIIYFQKELQFEKLFIYSLSTEIATLAVSISLAFILRNVWALVYGTLVGVTTKLILSYVLHPFRPSFKFDFDKAKELFRFGKWLLGSGILAFLITQGDDIFVGKLLGIAALGFYTMAYRLSNLPATEITHVISQVTFPAYSKLQDNIPKLRESYLKVLQLTAFLSFPITGLIFVLAPDFTMIFLGEKWMPMVPAMRALVVWGLIRSIGACTGPLFQAVGKPDLVFKMQFVRLILLIIIIYPLTKEYGILGTSIAVALTGLFTRPITDYLVIKIIKCHLWEFGKLIALPMLGIAIMSSTLFASKFFIFDSIGLFSFFALIVIGLIVYFSTATVFDWLFGYNIRVTIQNQFSLLYSKKV
jgi:O-antigen/teichoic acid export membrane protein